MFLICFVPHQNIVRYTCLPHTNLLCVLGAVVRAFQVFKTTTPLVNRISLVWVPRWLQNELLGRIPRKANQLPLRVFFVIFNSCLGNNTTKKHGLKFVSDLSALKAQ